MCFPPLCARMARMEDPSAETVIPTKEYTNGSRARDEQPRIDGKEGGGDGRARFVVPRNFYSTLVRQKNSAVNII